MQEERSQPQHSGAGQLEAGNGHQMRQRVEVAGGQDCSVSVTLSLTHQLDIHVEMLSRQVDTGVSSQERDPSWGHEHGNHSHVDGS